MSVLMIIVEVNVFSNMQFKYNVFVYFSDANEEASKDFDVQDLYCTMGKWR